MWSLKTGYSRNPTSGASGETVKTKSTEFGKTSETSTTDSIAIDVLIPENSRITASIISNSYETTIPYTAMLEKIYYDGTRKREKIKSQYKGVEVNEVSVQYGEVESLLSQSGEDDVARTKRKAIKPRPSSKELKDRFFILEILNFI